MEHALEKRCQLAYLCCFSAFSERYFIFRKFRLDPFIAIGQTIYNSELVYEFPNKILTTHGTTKTLVAKNVSRHSQKSSPD